MLSEEDAQKVRNTLHTLGWRDVMQPALVNRGKQAIKALTLSGSERTEQFKGTAYDTEDSVLRAMIRDCEWMISVWSNELAVSEHNRRIDELDRQDSNAPATNSR